jgi:nucleotide-binding universal stress UspA family protein
MPALKRDVLVAPLDFSPASDQIIDVAKEMVSNLSGLRFIHVLTPLDSLTPGLVWGELGPDNREAVVRNHAREVLHQKGLDGASFEVRLGHPAHEIVEYAAQAKADLIVLASHGYHGIKRFLLGSVAELVLRHAGCPVLVLRRPDAE